MGGGGGGGGGEIPFNMAALEPFMPSIFQGPYNAQGAEQNEETIAQKYPWIMTPAGNFEGAQPGQFAGSSNGQTNPFGFGMGFGGGLPGVGTVPPPNPPVPPTVGATPGAQVNPQAMATGAVNSMQPYPLQSVIAALTAGAPTSGGQ